MKFTGIEPNNNFIFTFVTFQFKTFAAKRLTLFEKFKNVPYFLIFCKTKAEKVAE
jgi:hypothetical protein